jgi:glycerate-2-kinase
MAAAVEAEAGDRIRSGLVVTKDGHGLPLERLALREYSHPVPDSRGAAAAREALDLASRARPDDLLLVLLSGGASALLTAPLPGLEMGDLVETTRALLACGADIDEMNAVRKHLGAFGGGRLARAASTRRIQVLAISDVPGDRLDVIGSGPCAADPSSFADALAVLHRRGIAAQVPSAVSSHLERGARGGLPETLKPGAPELARVESAIVAANRDARIAAAAAAGERGMRAVELGEVLSGEAREIGRCLAALGSCARPEAPVLMIAGGETTVTLRGSGRGGRSQELALAAAIELDGQGATALLAAGSDGSDGPTDAAGAFADGGSVGRGRAGGVDARRALADNDAYRFFAAEGGLLRTGPTRTNVMDLVLLLAQGRAAG